MDLDDPEKRIAEVDTLAPLDAWRPKGRVSCITRLTNVVITTCVLLSAASAGCTTTLGHPSPHDVQVPDVTGQPSADAIATLQNEGFKIRTLQKPDSNVAPDHVIDTDPKANTTVGRGSAITVNVSTGPGQRLIPDVANLSFADAKNRLTAAGFGTIKQVLTPSTTEQKDRVLGTSPPANQTAPVTFEISVLVGAGPAGVTVTDVAGQTEDQAKATLSAAGFTNVISSPVDSPKPAGAVLGTNPPAGQSVPKDTVIQLQVSKGNQFVMPDLTGMFLTDAEPQLRALGWTGILVKGADVPGSDEQRNRVVYQSPSPGTGVNRDANITLKFGS